jgi:hypothetical protein
MGARRGIRILVRRRGRGVHIVVVGSCKPHDMKTGDPEEAGPPDTLLA